MRGFTEAATRPVQISVTHGSSKLKFSLALYAAALAVLVGIGVLTGMQEASPAVQTIEEAGLTPGSDTLEGPEALQSRHVPHTLEGDGQAVNLTSEPTAMRHE
jgi:hypothetical protein